MKPIILFLLLLIISPLSYAESLRFKLLNSSDGLPQNSIRAITQDKNGLMWFATEDGIARYDGQNIKVYSHQPGVKLSLKENVANRFIANGQQLWIATQGEGGVSVLDQNRNEFHSLKPLSNASNLAALGNVVFALYQRSKTEMLVGSPNGVFSVSVNTLAINNQIISQAQLNNKDSVSAIWEDKENNIWVASRDGQLAYLNLEGKLTLVSNNINNFVRFKHIPAIGDMLVTEKGLMKLDYVEKRLIPLFEDTALSGMKIRDIVQSEDGLIWIATRSGLVRYNPKTDTALLANKTLEDESSLPTNHLETLYISKDGTLWIGTTDKGIAYTNIKGFGFKSYTTDNLKIIHPKQNQNSKLRSFKNNMIWSIFRDSRDTLWVGQSGNLSRQEKGEETYTNIDRFGDKTKGIEIHDSWVMAITEANGYLWFGTWGDGLIRYDPNTEETLLYSRESNDSSTTLSGNIIRLLLPDKARNVIWIGTHKNGLNRLDFTTGKITEFLPSTQNNHSFPHNRSRALFLDKDNRLWVGTGDGLALFDDKTEQFKRVKKYPSGEAMTDIRGIYQTDDNTLWSATGYGLDRVNIEKMQVEKKYLQEDGLSKSALYGFFPDSQGDLWIPTTRGLTRFNPKDISFERYFVGHNLQSNEFNFNSGLVDKDGSILLGGVGGLSQFNPLEVKDVKTSYDPVILSIKSIDNDFMERRVLGVFNGNTEKKKAFVLAPDQRSIVIDFVIPEYAFADNLKYEYQILDDEENWLTAKPRDTPIRYTNLKPGKYTFQIRKASAFGPTEKPLEITFKIKKYFWELGWFQFALFVLLGLLAYCFIRSITAYRLKRKIAQERAELYNMVVHDLGPALKRTQDDLLNLRKLSSSSNDEKDDLLNGLESDNQYSLSFINQLRSVSSVEGFSETKRLDFLLEDIVDESINSFRLKESSLKVNPIPDCTVRVYENSIEFIIKNLVSNALKYSEEEPSVIVDIQVISGKDIAISVSDNGIGINDAFKQKVFKPYKRGDYYKTDGLGLGLTLVKSIVKKYNGDISIKNNKPTGTIMTVTLKNIVVTA